VAQDHFRAQAIDDVRLSSAFHREEAHHFYERAGFEKTGYRFRKKLG
jgi:ribosomal protein S18 acetylase RimI-like enzyme